MRRRRPSTTRHETARASTCTHPRRQPPACPHPGLGRGSRSLVVRHDTAHTPSQTCSLRPHTRSRPTLCARCGLQPLAVTASMPLTIPRQPKHELVGRHAQVQPLLDAPLHGVERRVGARYAAPQNLQAAAASSGELEQPSLETVSVAAASARHYLPETGCHRPSQKASLQLRPGRASRNFARRCQTATRARPQTPWRPAARRAARPQRASRGQCSRPPPASRAVHSKKQAMAVSRSGTTPGPR